eukprot:TRINITY_DN12456_c0_g1_i1.p1 TRINITY_DN12456_c0_g1~~TRINITY_DN12456_c0_g1_i1.p1  ORF type:complete len:364 (-),score=31.94 TRINITY_DN12456_c0_g1_i1:158-1249(-)
MVLSTFASDSILSAIRGMTYNSSVLWETGRNLFVVLSNILGAYPTRTTRDVVFSAGLLVQQAIMKNTTIYSWREINTENIQALSVRANPIDLLVYNLSIGDGGFFAQNEHFAIHVLHSKRDNSSCTVDYHLMAFTGAGRTGTGLVLGALGGADGLVVADVQSITVVESITNEVLSITGLKENEMIEYQFLVRRTEDTYNSHFQCVVRPPPTPSDFRVDLPNYDYLWSNEGVELMDIATAEDVFPLDVPRAFRCLASRLSMFSVEARVGITGVTGCYDLLPSGTLCYNNLADLVLTIKGNNFGRAGARAGIGPALQCINVTHLEPQPTQLLRCAGLLSLSNESVLPETPYHVMISNRQTGTGMR